MITLNTYDMHVRNKQNVTFGTNLKKPLQKVIEELYGNGQKAIPQRVLNKLQELKTDGLDTMDLTVQRKNESNLLTAYDKKFPKISVTVFNLDGNAHNFEEKFLRVTSTKIKDALNKLISENSNKSQEQQDYIKKSYKKLTDLFT